MKRHLLFLLFLVDVISNQEVDNLSVEEKVDLLFQTYQDGLQNTLDRATQSIILLSADVIRAAHSECIWIICNHRNVSAEGIQEKCQSIYSKIIDRPQIPLIQKLAYELGELFPLLESLNISRVDFSEAFVNVLNTREYDFCCDSWNLRQKYFWQALKPSSFGSTSLKTDPCQFVNMTKEEKRVIIFTFAKLIDNVPARTINSMLSLEQLQIALDFNTSAVSRASKLKEIQHTDWSQALAFLRLASAFKINQHIFSKYTNNLPQRTYNCIRLGKEAEYLETSPTSRYREDLILHRFLNTIPEDAKYEILTKLTGNAKQGLPVHPKLLEEIGKALEPYEKQLPDGYQALFEALIGSNGFQEAHERLQRKILWRTVIQCQRDEPPTELEEKEYPETALTALIEEINKTRIVGELDRRGEREVAKKMVEIVYNSSLDEEAKIRETNEFIQWRRDLRKNPFLCVDCYQFSSSLKVTLTEANLDPIPALQKTYFLAQSQDFRDFGELLKKKTLKKVLDFEVKLEQLDSAVENEVYNLMTIVK